MDDYHSTNAPAVSGRQENAPVEGAATGDSRGETMKDDSGGDPHNLISYLKEEQRDFAEAEATDVDLLAFCQVMVAEYEAHPECLEDDCSLPISNIGDLGSLQGLLIHVPNFDLSLAAMEATISSKRYGRVRLEHFECIVDESRDTQWAGGCFPLDDETVVVCFRSTDHHAAGWIENMNMFSMAAVPAQEESQRYLNEATEWYPEARFLICGHSKGGSCAEYAAVFSDGDLASRIERVATFDAPSIMRCGGDRCPEFAEYDAELERRFEKLSFPIGHYVFSSMFGLMQEARGSEEFDFVECTDKRHAHDTCTARIEDGEFCLFMPDDDQLSDGYLLSRWVRGLSLEERRAVSCLLKAVVSKTGLDAILGTGASGIGRLAGELWRGYRGLPRVQKRPARRALRAFVKASRD